MKFKGTEIRHIHRVLSSDIDECTNLLEGDIPEERVPIIAARMEEDRRILEMIEFEFLAHPEWRNFMPMMGTEAGEVTEEEIREFMSTPVELTQEEEAMLKKMSDDLPSNIRKWKAAEQGCVVPKDEEQDMDYEAFLTRVIDDGVEAVKVDYANDPERREGLRSS